MSSIFQGLTNIAPYRGGWVGGRVGGGLDRWVGGWVGRYKETYQEHAGAGDKLGENQDARVGFLFLFLFLLLLAGQVNRA